MLYLAETKLYGQGPLSTYSRKRGCLAELGVGATKQYSPELTALRFVHKPLATENGYEADPSHSEIIGLPQGDSPQAALIGDLIAECIQAIHPALIDD